uniref:Uncharacterized protein n=1 Tax=Heterorhabditis bacteriophora TaxID=37862 RepID=A0A1I7X8G2_HETBA
MEEKGGVLMLAIVQVRSECGREFETHYCKVEMISDKYAKSGDITTENTPRKKHIFIEYMGNSFPLWGYSIGDAAVQGRTTKDYAVK